MKKRIGGWLAGLMCLLLACIGPAQAFEDDEACLMCHNYPKMGRITEDGVQKHYFVIPDVFSKTVHRNVPCRDCHNYIKELPHKPVTEGGPATRSATPSRTRPPASPSATSRSTTCSRRACMAARR